MIESMKRALEYATGKSEDPAKMKEHVEEYFAKTGGDRRYKFRWKAFSGNSKYTFSGIFEYRGKAYYFNKIGGEIKLEYHNR